MQDSVAHAPGHAHTSSPIRSLNHDCATEVVRLLSFGEAVRAVYAGCFPGRCVKQLNIDDDRDNRGLMNLLSREEAMPSVPQMNKSVKRRQNQYRTPSALFLSKRTSPHSVLNHVQVVRTTGLWFSTSFFLCTFKLEAMPPSLTELTAPCHTLAVEANTATLLLPNLSTLNIGRIAMPPSSTGRQNFSLHSIAPSLTSLSISVDVSFEALEFALGDAAVSCQMCSLRLPVQSWVTVLNRFHPSWPMLHTLALGDLTLFYACDTARSCVIPAPDCLPSLTKLSVFQFSRRVFDLALLGKLKSLEHLVLSLESHPAAINVLESMTENTFPPSLTRLEWTNQVGAERPDLPAAMERLLDSLPPGLQCLVLPDCSSFITAEGLRRDVRLRRLTHLVAECEEYYKVEAEDGTQQWHSLSSILQNPDTSVRPLLYRFEMIKNPEAYTKKNTATRHFLTNVVHDALANYPEIGLRIARHLSSVDADFLPSLDFSTLCTLLEHYSCSVPNVRTAALWMMIVRRISIASRLMSACDVTSRLMALLQRYSITSHPTTFRHLLHIIYVTFKSCTCYGDRTQHLGDSITASLKSLFQYESAFTSDVNSSITMASLERFATNGNWSLSDRLVYMKKWLFAMDHPRLAELACQGESNACNWFDDFRLSRVVQMIKRGLRDADHISVDIGSGGYKLEYRYLSRIITILVDYQLDRCRSHSALGGKEKMVTLTANGATHYVYDSGSSYDTTLQRDVIIVDSVIDRVKKAISGKI